MTKEHHIQDYVIQSALDNGTNTVIATAQTEGEYNEVWEQKKKTVLKEIGMELIDRNALRIAIMKGEDIDITEYSLTKEYRYIEDAPVVAIKTGHWILTIEDWNKWTCSECGWSTRTDIHVKLGYDFCPKCGADMIEPQESEG